MINPYVLIVMPSLNSENFITKSIDSAMTQSYCNIHLVIVDGGSSDKTINIIERSIELYGNDRITLINDYDNLGIAHARMVGINSLKSDYVAFLDSDDLWDKNKIKNQIEFMLKNKYPFTYTKYGIINEHDLVVNKNISMDIRYDFYSALKHRGIGTSTVVIETKLLQNNKLKIFKSGGEDYAWWLEIMKDGVIANCYPEIMTYYRRSKSNKSSSIFHRLYTFINIFKVYRKVIGGSEFLHVYYYMNYCINGIVKKIKDKKNDNV